MVKRIQYFCMLFYVSILLVLVAACFGAFEGLHASPKVIETFEAGPIKTEKKQVVKVKTQFEWNMANPCKCNGEGGPCIKTFLNKDQPQAESKDFQINNNLNQSSEKYQGSNLVPTLTNESSVRLIVIPFCRQTKSNE